MTVYTELFLGKQFWIIPLCVEFSNKVPLDSCSFNLSPHSDELVCYLIEIFFLMGKNKLEIRQYKNMSRLSFSPVTHLHRYKTRVHDMRKL